jgi:hypothetical protein
VIVALPQAPETARYTPALLKGRGLVGEMRTLLRAWQPGEREPSLARRALAEDLLGKATAKRVHDVVHVFARRLLIPTDGPARHLKPLADADSPRQLLSDLLFYYSARCDPLIWDFTVERYWPAVRDGRLSLPNTVAADFLWQAQQEGHIARPWSQEVKRELGGRLLGLLADFGLLDAYRGRQRRILDYRPADGTVLCLVHKLHARGIPDGFLAEQDDWRVFGLEPARVWTRLDALAGESWFIIQRAGQVARITWRYSDPAEVIGALVGS